MSNTPPEPTSRFPVVGTGLIDPAERERIEKAQRALLDEDLGTQRLEFRSRPYMADVQFTNYCNMSCIMCYDGENPPLKRMSEPVLEKLAREIAPSLSIINPFGGSEPLAITWDETQRIARENGILLDIVTNAQLLDERRFEELVGITQTLFFSIDSHLPSIYERIRLRSNPKKVFKNLERAAQLCQEHEIECMVNFVLMTENAALLPQTLEYMADIGIPALNVIQYVDFNGHRDASDPLLHFSSEYLAWLQERSVETAKRRGLRLIWSVAGYREWDFRREKIEPLERKRWNDHWVWRFKHRHPGYCKQSHNRIRVDADGDVYPCCYALDGDLRLGRLTDQSFEEIWNGPEARDLRRGMLSGDVPTLCEKCRFRDHYPPESDLPLAHLIGHELSNERPVDASLEIVGPDHVLRTEAPPVFQVQAPEKPVAEYLLALSIGGEADEVKRLRFESPDVRDGVVHLPIDEADWRALPTNVGLWWCVFARGAGENASWQRTRTLRAIISHRALPRVAGSTLQYSDQGHQATRYLGGNKRVGFEAPASVEPAPEVPTPPPPGLRALLKRTLRRLGLVPSR
ncbi:MAG: radical SAM protein [Planctomycetota bacterium]